MAELTCDEMEDLVPELLDGTVPSAVLDDALAHLAACETCRIVVDELTGVRTLAAEHGPLTLPADAKERIRRSLADPPR